MFSILREPEAKAVTIHLRDFTVVRQAVQQGRCRVFTLGIMALSLPTKLGCLKWICGATTWEIIDFSGAMPKRSYPEVMVGECFGCEFQDGFGSTASMIEEDQKE